MLRFHVNNLGKVRSADISLAPLSILVGKNNTGKSYVATLIWSLSNLSGLLMGDEAKKTRPKWVEEFLDFSRASVDRTLVLDEEKSGDVIRHVNYLFKKEGSVFLGTVFAFDGFSKTSVAIEAGEFTPFEIRVSVAREETRRQPERDEVFVRFIDADGIEVRSIRFQLQHFLETPFFKDMIFEEIVYTVISGFTDSFSRTAYIPAARTGLMIALNSLASDRFAPGSRRKVDLPLPLNSFLSDVSEPVFQYFKRDKTDLGNWLQQSVVHGDLEFDGTSAKTSYTYKPSGLDIQLPLYATSSMITELAPYIVAFKAEMKGKHFILEEPEAHLHLEAQREMARVISRLINAGAQVTLTTHSDTFLQQINNLMALSEHPKKRSLMRKFGYQNEDLLDPALVEAYEFNASSGLTEVRRLEKTPEGFVVPSLNSTLLALAKETIALRER